MISQPYRQIDWPHDTFFPSNGIAVGLCFCNGRSKIEWFGYFGTVRDRIKQLIFDDIWKTTCHIAQIWWLKTTLDEESNGAIRICASSTILKKLGNATFRTLELIAFSHNKTPAGSKVDTPRPIVFLTGSRMVQVISVPPCAQSFLRCRECYFRK